MQANSTASTCFTNEWRVADVDGTPVADDDEFDIAVNNYRATSQLLSPGIIFEEAICLLFWKPMSGETSAVSGT